MVIEMKEVTEMLSKEDVFVEWNLYSPHLNMTLQGEVQIEKATWEVDELYEAFNEHIGGVVSRLNAKDPVKYSCLIDYPEDISGTLDVFTVEIID